MSSNNPEKRYADSKQLFITIYAELNYEEINNLINKISKAIKKQTHIF
jgi:hypothetical protein